MQTAPGASATAAAKAATGTVGGISPIGMATATAVAAASHPPSAVVSASHSALVTATGSSATGWIATTMSAAAARLRGRRLPAQRLARHPPPKGAPSARKGGVAVAVVAGVDDAVAAGARAPRRR